MPFQTPRLPARPHVDLDMSSATIAHTAIQDASSTEATVLRGRPEGLRLRNRPPSRAAVPAASRARWAGGQFFSWDVGRGTGTTDDGRQWTIAKVGFYKVVYTSKRAQKLTSNRLEQPQMAPKKCRVLLPPLKLVT